MDYEKKYEELVGQIKKAHLYAQTDSTKAVLEDILPELKESEDEKIRGAIIHFISHTPTVPKGIIGKETMITWLEKQGAQNPYSGVSFEYNGHTWGMCARDNGVEILVDGEIKERVYLFDRPQGKSALETLKEEKVDNQNCANPADKVEPKYHEGDWVVDKEGQICKIMRVVNNFNHISYACRFIEQKSVFWSSYSENDIRLWDITEDAKAGDVLVDGNLPFIFKKIDTNKHIYAYCGISVDDGFKIESDGESGEWTWMQDIKPATEEQRDVLFAKMREAGYEWDAEKKELKKVEQSKLTAFEEAVKDMMDDYRDAVDGNKVTTEEVKERAAYMLSLIPQKPAEWSEDDEEYLRRAINAMKDTHPKTTDWLKSLKERVACEANCTTTKEWSEEDEIWIDRACMLLDELNHLSTLTLAKIPSNVNDIISHLKTLKEHVYPQNAWKPSEEQIDALSNILKYFRTLNAEEETGETIDRLVDLHEQLKKLREE